MVYEDSTVCGCLKNGSIRHSLGYIMCAYLLGLSIIVKKVGSVECLLSTEKKEMKSPWR